MDVASAVWTTVAASVLATAAAGMIAIPLGYLTARARFPGRGALAVLLMLPMVLPPTAIGYLLLQTFADRGPLGLLLDRIGIEVLLSFPGLVIACAVMAFPLAFRACRAAFESVDPDLEALSRTLGVGPLKTFATVTLPLAARGLAAGMVLGLARAMGEFGASITLAGNIPGQTQTIASAIYAAYESGRDGAAAALILIALGVGFAALGLTEWLGRTSGGRHARQAAPKQPDAA